MLFTAFWLIVLNGIRTMRWSPARELAIFLASFLIIHGLVESYIAAPGLNTPTFALALLVSTIASDSFERAASRRAQ